MRGTFVRTLTELAECEPSILLLTGDLGYLALDRFIERFSDRFFNVGVAEQNMVGLATGLAEAGYLPFVYSIVTFATLRPYEFIRNGPILHQFPVRIVGVGGGLEYGANGISHHGLEDIGVMRLQPGITIVAPADYQQTRSALLATWNLPGPIYYRLGKDDKTIVAGLEGRFELGRAQFIGDGDDFLFITMGSICSEVVAAANTLTAEGIACTVMIVSSFNPEPREDLIQTLPRFQQALVVEAHYVVGGLGSLVSEIVAEQRLSCKITRCGVRTSSYNGVSGSQGYLHKTHNISSEALLEIVHHTLQESH